MSMNWGSANIVASVKHLKGNTRTSVVFEPMWSIPFVFYNFYLSLYMKSMGISDVQIGILIAVGHISGILFSMIGGIVTDALGRKKTSLLCGLIGWPGSVLIYLFAHSFWMFALGFLINAVTRISTISWTLMVVEDADDQQVMSAFNLLSIIDICAGVFTPLAGLLVGYLGLGGAEKLFFIFAIIFMTAQMVLRDRLYTETSMGKTIIKKRAEQKKSSEPKQGLYRQTFEALRENPKAILVIVLNILFNVYILLGSYSSLYFAPYLTEVLRLDQSVISIVGSIYSIAMLIVFILVVPAIRGFNKLSVLLWGLCIQIASMTLFIFMPGGSFMMAAFAVVMLSVGAGIFRPFLDTVLAEATYGSQRAGIYSLFNTVISILSALAGAISGYFYALNPRLLYAFSILILSLCVITVCFSAKLSRKKEA